MVNPKVVDCLTPKKKGGNGMGDKIDLQKALELRLKGMLYQDIGKLFNCSKQAVQARLKPYVAHMDVDTETYKSNRADIFATKQAAVLAELTGDKLKDIVAKSPMAAVTLFNSLFNNERLERGLSTQNTAVLMASAVIEADERAAKKGQSVTPSVTLDAETVP